MGDRFSSNIRSNLGSREAAVERASSYRENDGLSQDLLERVDSSKSRQPSRKSTPTSAKSGQSSEKSTPNDKKRTPLAVVSQNEVGAAAAAAAATGPVPLPPPLPFGNSRAQPVEPLHESWAEDIPVIADSFVPGSNWRVGHSFQHQFQTKEGNSALNVECVDAPAKGRVPRNVFWLIGRTSDKPALGGSVIRDMGQQKFEIKYGKSDACEIPRFGEQVVRMTLGDSKKIGISPTKIYAEVSSQDDVGSNISSYLTLHWAGFVLVRREGGDKIRFVHPESVPGSEVISEVLQHLTEYPKEASEKDAWADKLAEIIGEL